MRDYRAEAAEHIQRALASVPPEALRQFADEIRAANRIFFTGAGRSFLMLKSMAMALMQIGYQVHATGDVSTPSIRPGDLLVVASSSGETRSVVLFAEQCHAIGARIALITERPGSSLGQLADLVITMGDGRLQQGPHWNTGSFFELALGPLGDCVVEDLAESTGASHASIAAQHANLE